MSIGKLGIERLLRNAKRKVRVIGVVPFDADWIVIRDSWRTRKEPLDALVLCESDNLLFERALMLDSERANTRRSFSQLKFIRDRVVGTPFGETAGVELTYLDIPLFVVAVDDRIFVNLWLDELTDRYEEVRNGHVWRGAIESYLSAYFDPATGRKYASPPGKELLTLYDHDRVPRGIFPRESFYDTDFSQLVVWALIFDRKGRILLHKRSDNAKDNRSMWDKSAGGHFDYAFDLDTSRTVVREVIEELFSDELGENALMKAFSPSFEEMVYVGEWRPDQRHEYPFQEIAAYENEWAVFRLPESQHLPSPRILPDDGGRRRLNVIADVFVFVAGSKLNDHSIASLKNSDFKLVEVSDLKNAMDRAGRGEACTGFDPEQTVPKFTPDLTTIMNGKIRDTLEDFSQFIKRYIFDNS